MGSKTGSRHKSYTLHLQQAAQQPSSTSTMTAYPDSATAHNRDLALHKYMLLQTQHQSLREHLDQLRPLVTMTSCNTAVTSPAHSPERSPFSPVSPATASFSTATSAYPGTGRSHRRSSMPARDAPVDYRRRGSRLEPVVDERAMYEIMAEERKLFNVNECIKRTLTEMLNCEDARTDPNFRMWVQCRLMETEKELRVERRRRSSAGTDYS